MPTQVAKLEAHAGHLLDVDAFIRLRERYALLDPMLFNVDVPKARGSGHQKRGFLTLRHSLFLSCAQDIANLTNDSDRRTPSIHNLVAALEDASVLKALRENFSQWHIPSIEQETDPEIVEALRKMELREKKDRGKQFDEIIRTIEADWENLSNAPYLAGFVTIRDKVSAHTEVQLIADKYQLVDIAALGIKWSDMKKAIDTMQRLVENLGLVIRNSGFAWDMLDNQLSKASIAFWLP